MSSGATLSSPRAMARPTTPCAKGLSNMVGKRVRMSMRMSIQQARHRLDAHDAGGQVDGDDDVADGRDQDLALRAPHDVDVVGPGREHVGDGADLASAGRDGAQAQEIFDEKSAFG